MIDDAADAVDKSIVQYLQHVDKQDGQLPEGFVLKDYMEFRQLHAEEMVDPAMMNLISSWSKRYPTRNFLEGALAKSVGYAEEVKKREKDKKNEPTLAPEQPGSDVIGPAATEIKQILPKTTEPKTEEPKTEEPKTEEPKTEEPKTEEPKTEEPKTEEPKTEEPKTEEPKTEEPKTEEPKTDEPKDPKGP
jgi:cell division protein FtsN